MLRTGEVPYVVMDPNYTGRKDPISAFIREHYELVPDDVLRSWGVWRLRRASVPGASRLDE